MAKKSNSMTWIIVGLAVLLIAFIVYGNQKKKRLTKGGASADGCYPMEEVHETSTGSGRMWVCIIPMAADNVTTIRPPIYNRIYWISSRWNIYYPRYLV